MTSLKAFDTYTLPDLNSKYQTEMYTKGLIYKILDIVDQYIYKVFLKNGKIVLLMVFFINFDYFFIELICNFFCCCFRMNKMMEFNVLNNVDLIQKELDEFYTRYSQNSQRNIYNIIYRYILIYFCYVLPNQTCLTKHDIF